MGIFQKIMMLYLPAKLRVILFLIMAAILLVAVLWLAVYANTPPVLQNTSQAAETGTPTLSATALPASYPSTPTPVATPGLVVYGVVRDINGVGVENVEIYRKYASYAGILIATTDGQGYYQSDFYEIPGDEMVSVWASKPGLMFDPEYRYWRHYYGYEITRLDFSQRSP